MIRVLQILFLFLGLNNAVKAQGLELGVTAGGMGYIGDLNQTNYLNVTDLAFGGMIKKNFDGYWSLKLALLQGKVRANDANSKYLQERERNLSFFSPVTEGSMMVEFNFFNYGIDFSRKRITPFLFTGVSIFNFNPKVKYNGEVYELKRYGTEGQDIKFSLSYNTISLAIPFGAGVKFRVAEKLNLITEIGYRKTSTDYLDDVSGLYPDPSSLNDANPNQTTLRNRFSNPSSTLSNSLINTQRGDLRKNDTYLFVGLTLSYTFVSQKCSSF